MTRRSILMLAKTGFIIRDLLLGKFAERIIEECDLTVAVPDPENEDLVKFVQNKPIKLIPFFQAVDHQSTFKAFLSAQHWVHRIKQVERKNSSLDITTVLLRSRFSSNQKLLVNGMMALGWIVKNLNLTDIADSIFLSHISNWEVTKRWMDVIECIKPDFLVSTMLTLPESLFLPSVDLPPVLAAQKLGIPVGTLVQSWDNLSSKAYALPRNIRRYWTWSEAMSKDLHRFNPFISDCNVKIVGSPHYDYHLDATLIEDKKTFMNRLGLDHRQPYLLIGTGTKTMFPDAPNAMVHLVGKIRQALPDIQILIRIHPKDTHGRWDDFLENLASHNIFFQNTNPAIPMDSGGFTSPKVYFQELINTLTHASVVINASSSLSVDAAILNRPIITLCYDNVPDARFPLGRSWSYNYSDHFKSLIETRGIKAVHSDDECVEAIKIYLAHPELHANERKMVANMIGGRLDGMAGKRLADDVLTLGLSND